MTEILCCLYMAIGGHLKIHCNIVGKNSFLNSQAVRTDP